MTPAITEDMICAALRTWLLLVVPSGVEVVQGQANRVPEPLGDNYIVFWPLSRLRTATNVDTWDVSGDAAPEAIAHAHGTDVGFQIDLHGPGGADMAQTVATLWRDEYGTRTFNAAIGAPLYATDGRQAPFINGEKQYETRWAMTLHLHTAPIVSTPQEFADSVTVTINPPVGD